MIVVDTSVAVKWFVAEDETPDAFALLSRAIIAPDLLQVELGHVLTKKVRRGEIVEDHARGSFGDVIALLSLLPTRPYGSLAFQLSLDLKHSIYDCYFLALAIEHGLMLVTADRRFARKVAVTRHAPLVVVLGDVLPHG